MKTNIDFWSYLIPFVLEWEMFKTNVVEKIKAYILMLNPPPRKSFRLWDSVENIVKAGRPQMTIWRLRIAAEYVRLQTHSEYVILVAFPLQQWLHEHASVLC